MNSNDFISARLKPVLFTLMLIIFFCQPVYAIVEINVLYNDKNSSSRFFKEQLTKTLLLYEIKYQIFNLDKVVNIREHLSSKYEPADDIIYITLGSKALKTAWEQLTDKKIFSLMVSQEKIKKIIGVHSRINDLYGLYQEQSIQRQVFLAQQLLPGIRNIGFLTTPDNFAALKDQLNHFQSETNYEIQTVSDQTSLGKALSYINQNSDLLIALAEPEIYNRSSLRNILLSSYRNNIPLLGLNNAFVNAGCLAAVYTTNEQFAKETAQIIRMISYGQPLPKINYARNFKISVNHKVADSLGLYLKSENELLAGMTDNE